MHGAVGRPRILRCSAGSVGCNETMANRHPHILTRDCALLALIDLQEPFLRGIDDRQRVIDRCRFLAQSATILGVPIVGTLQYAERMGGYVPEIAEFVPLPIDKMSFSSAGSGAFCDHLRDSGRRQILLAGVETHICIAQTALDLLHHGYQVHVAADAVSARTMDRHKLGMEKLRDAGVIPCCAEQAVFEMLEVSGSDEFKQVLKLVKE
jgi:isochorismate hydrolase